MRIADSSTDTLWPAIALSSDGPQRICIPAYGLRVASTERLRADQPVLIGEDNRLHPVARVDFREDMRHMRFHGR